MSKIKFIFDLDGTITSEETLPLIAKHFNVQEGIEQLTRETIQGDIPFVESFIRRVFILGKLPVDEVAALLENVKMYPELSDFVRTHGLVATGARTWWWTSDTEYGDSNSGWDRKIEQDYEAMKRTRNHKSVGFSVRCVRN